MKILFTIFFASIISYTTLPAQQATIELPQIGKPMPDLTLNGIRHFKKKQARISEFRGSWLILDFWSRTCVGGIRTVVEANQLQKKFKGQIQFILIGDNSAEGLGKDIEGLYERMRRLQDLQLPILYDSTMLQAWDQHMVPHIIIIDPNGIVKAITTEMPETKLAALLSGQAAWFPSPVFDPLRGIKKYDTTPQGYSSKLALWNGEDRILMPLKQYLRLKRGAGYRITQTPLELLYKTAYLGEWYWGFRDSLYSKVYPHVLVELPTDSKVRQMMEHPSLLFNYELTIPDSLNTSEKIMQIMQNDLKSAFGVEATLETRDMPVWKLVALPGAQQWLKTKGKGTGDKYYSDGDAGAGGFSYQNWPLTVALERIIRFMDPYGDPVTDETGIQGNIDITFDAMLTDFSQVRQELRRNNLDLVKGTKKMLVVVVKNAAL